jgi:hypothetical protein
MARLPRLLAPAVIMGVMCGTAPPQAAQPEGRPGPDGGPTAIFGSDIARVLDDGELRGIPVLGKGPVPNVVNILCLNAIDVGMVAGDALEVYKLQYKVPDIALRLRQIAKLHNNELHVIAPTSIRSISDSGGKRIVAQTDVGYYSTKVISSRLNMRVTYDHWTDDSRAIQKIIDGEADAYLGSAGKGFSLARTIKNENRSRRLQDLSLPTTLSGEEYPNLLARDEKIEAVATGVLLVTLQLAREQRNGIDGRRSSWTPSSKIDEFLKPPRHPKWGESSINAKIPGWEHLKAADEWVAQHVGGGAATAELPQNCSNVSSAKIMSATLPRRIERRFFASFWSGRRSSPRCGEIRQDKVA